MPAGAGGGIPGVTSALSEMADQAARGAKNLTDWVKAQNDEDAARRARSTAANAASNQRQKDDYDDKAGPKWESLHDRGRSDADSMNSKSSPSGTTAIEVNPGLNPLDTSVLDMEGFTKGSYQAGGRNVAAYDTKVASDFDDLAKRIDSAFGKSNYFGTVFSTLAQFIREGRFSGATANQYAQGILGNFAAGLFQESSDPTSSPQMRALDSELLRFFSSGRI